MWVLWVFTTARLWDVMHGLNISTTKGTEAIAGFLWQRCQKGDHQKSHCISFSDKETVAVHVKIWYTTIMADLWRVDEYETRSING